MQLPGLALYQGTHLCEMSLLICYLYRIKFCVGSFHATEKSHTGFDISGTHTHIDVVLKDQFSILTAQMRT